MKKLLLVVLLLFAATSLGQNEPEKTITAEQVQKFREQVQQELGYPVKDLNAKLDVLIKKRGLSDKTTDNDSMALIRPDVFMAPSAPASATSLK